MPFIYEGSTHKFVFKIKEIKTWQNVQSVEKRFNLRKLGRWLADQTKQEKEQN